MPIALPLTTAVIRWRMRISPGTAGRARERIRAIFEEVGERMKDGRAFLVGNRLGAADITFCSLAAPVLFPPGYRGSLPALEELPEDARAEVLQFREMAAGRYAMRVFSENRAQPFSSSASA